MKKSVPTRAKSTRATATVDDSDWKRTKRTADVMTPIPRRSRQGTGLQRHHRRRRAPSARRFRGSVFRMGRLTAALGGPCGSFPRDTYACPRRPALATVMASAGERKEMTKTLCGIDGRSQSARVVGVAAELAKKLGAQLTLYIVNPSVPGRGARHPLWADEYLQRTLQEMKHRALWSGAPDVRCESRAANDVADAIVAYADRHEVDYIIVGASGRPGILTLLRGSVSRQVVARANCPVIVVTGIRTRSGRDTHRGIPEPVVYRGVAPSVA